MKDPVKHYDDEYAFVSGWGDLSPDGEQPDNLQFIFLKTISNQQCSKIYEGRNIKITDFMICAEHHGFEKGGYCHGDDGGALVRLKRSDANGELFQIGIATYGGEGAKCDGVNVFTRLSTFTDWIEKNKKP